MALDLQRVDAGRTTAGEALGLELRRPVERSGATSARWRRTTPSATTRSRRAALRARTMSAGRSRTMATAGTPAAAARRHAAPAGRCAVMFVASTTVSRRARSAAGEAAMEPPERRPADGLVRGIAGDAAPGTHRTTGSRLGSKCRAANVDLPEPAAPIRTTRLGSGIAISSDGRAFSAARSSAPRAGPRIRRPRRRGSRRPAGRTRRAPVPRARRSSRNREPCHGHWMQPSTTVPSGSGPPAWAHTACSA